MSRIEEIREAIGKRKLIEPFGQEDLEEVFPDWPEGTRNAFLWKHYDESPRSYGGVYFVKVRPGKFRLKR